MLRTWMGDQIRIPRVEITSVFLPSLSKAMLKTAQLPGLCEVVSFISELFVPSPRPHSRIYIYNIVYYKQTAKHVLSFAFFSILLTFDRVKQ